MRNFEERMAEIKKRSHARIARRRKQLTMLCLPLVAMLCIGGTLLTRPNENGYTTSLQSTAQQGSSLTVQTGEKSKTYTNANRVEKTILLLESLCVVEETYIATTQTYSSHTDAAVEVISCTFVLKAEDGATESYKLYDRVVTDQETLEVYVLTEAQYQELLKLLGLPDK